MDISFRLVDDRETFDQVTKLRYRVSIGELGKHCSNADHARAAIADELDAASSILVAHDGDQLIATARLTPAAALAPDSPWRAFYDLPRFSTYPDANLSITSRFVVDPDYRGTPVGARLLGMAYERGRSIGTIFNFMHCAPGLVPIYEAMGFQRYGSGKIDPDVGFRIPMVLVADDVARLDRIGTPLAALARRFPSDSSNARWFLESFGSSADPSSARALGVEAFTRRVLAHLPDPRDILLDGLTPEQVRATIERGVLHRLDRHEHLIRNGDRDRDISLVLDGLVEVDASAGAPASPRLVGKGAVIGERSFLANVPRDINVRAAEKTTLLSIGAESLQRFAHEQPQTAYRLVLNIAVMGAAAR